MLARLAAFADLPPPRLALMATDIPNAFAREETPSTAWSSRRRACSPGVEPRELEAGLAHEPSHIPTRDDAPIITALALPAVAARRVLPW
jgi:heat shock protein HtpX